MGKLGKKKALGKGLKDLLPGQGMDEGKKSPKNMEAQNKREEIQKIVDEYRNKGFIVAKLSKSMKKDVKAMEAAQKEFMEGLKKLEEAKEIYREREAYRRLLESLFSTYERKTQLLSREITRRTSLRREL